MEIYLGDNLALLQHFYRRGGGSTIDFIYVDPPYFSGKNYAFPNSMSAAFVDTKQHFQQMAFLEEEVLALGEVGRRCRQLVEALSLSPAQRGYLYFLFPRIYYMWLLLKDTGVLALQGLPSQALFLQAMLSLIFQSRHHLNTLVWNRRCKKNSASRNFSSQYDLIFLYTKSRRYYFHNPKEETTEKRKRILYELDGTPYTLVPLFQSRPDERQVLYWDQTPIFHPRGYAFRISQQTLDRRRKLFYEKYGKEYLVMIGGVPYGKSYDVHKVRPPQSNLWDDIRSAADFYHRPFPTGKPVRLLERLLFHLVPEGGKVADFFLGGGALAVAAALRRLECIGCDISHKAILTTQVALTRLSQRCHLYGVPSQPSEAPAPLSLAALWNKPLSVQEVFLLLFGMRSFRRATKLTAVPPNQLIYHFKQKTLHIIFFLYYRQLPTAIDPSHQVVLVVDEPASAPATPFAIHHLLFACQAPLSLPLNNDEPPPKKTTNNTINKC